MESLGGNPSCLVVLEYFMSGELKKSTMKMAMEHLNFMGNL
jgi:hypothetical protein